MAGIITGLCKCLWDTWMLLLTTAYSIIVMYEYNRSGVHQIDPDNEVIVAQGRGAWDRRLTVYNHCEVNLREWGTWEAWVVNWTAVVAIVLALDQLKIVTNLFCRRGHYQTCALWYYLAQCDNLFNLATTLVEWFAMWNMLIPNAVGSISNLVSTKVKDCIGQRGLGYYAESPRQQAEDIMASIKSEHGMPTVPSAREMEEFGDTDHTTCDHVVDYAWEVFTSVIIGLSLLQTVLMPLSKCETGPTLDQSALGVPKFDITDWRDYDYSKGGYSYYGNQALMNSAAIMAFFFVADVIVEWCVATSESGYSKVYNFVSNASRLHKLIIAVQTILLTFNCPYPAALGRIVKPLFVVGKCAGKRQSSYYTQVHEEVFGTREIEMAKHHEVERGCCSRGALDKWTC